MGISVVICDFGVLPGCAEDVLNFFESCKYPDLQYDVHNCDDIDDDDDDGDSSSQRQRTLFCLDDDENDVD